MLFVRQRGYTLIEMLIVVSIVALLSGAILASVRNGRIRARDAKRKSDLRQIQTALALYYDTLTQRVFGTNGTEVLRVRLAEPLQLAGK